MGHQKKHTRRHHKKRTMRGKGYTTGPGYDGTPGLLTRTMYPNAGGSDCPTSPDFVRYGYITNPSPSTGLPMNGGRYESSVEGPLSSNGIGITPGATPIPCEMSKTMAGGVQVGNVDSMRYYAPTAGYSNVPMVPFPASNPGILMQVPYEARHYNKACVGGKTRKGKKGKKSKKSRTRTKKR